MLTGLRRSLGPMTRPRLHALLLLPAGLVLGHEVAYTLVDPPPDLLASGHGYLGALGAVSLPLVLLAVAFSALLGTRGERAPSTWLVAGSLGGSFVGLETAEQLLAGTSLLDVVGETSLWFGAAVEIAVGLLAAWLLRGSATAAAGFVARRRRGARRRMSAPPAAAPPDVVVVALPGRDVRRRGPPSARSGPDRVGARAPVEGDEVGCHDGRRRMAPSVPVGAWMPRDRGAGRRAVRRARVGAR